MNRRNRRKTLKEIDADEYEDEIWLAYVEPQYENEFSRMIVAQNKPLQRKQFEDEQAQAKREFVRKEMAKLNPNTEIPLPKRIMIKKAAIDFAEYDYVRQMARERGEVIKNLDEPADPVQL